MKTMLATVLSALPIALTALTAPAAWAQATQFPDKPVRLVVPFPPGGGSDALARILSKKMPEIWSQPLVVDNRGGTQGSLGTASGIKAPADGYTITLIVHGAMAINPFIYQSVGYDVTKDFAPVIRATEQSYILVANPKVPVNNLKELEALAKRQPGKLTFATSGAGPQLVGELFKLTTKTHLLHVPYKGAGPAVLAVLAGETDFMISNPTAVVPHLKAGKLKGIAVLGKARNDAIPDVPHALEAGYPALSDIPEWYGFAVPAGTPAAIVNKLNADFARALNSPDVQAAIRGLGTTPSPSTPDEFARQIAFDYERWGRVVREAGVKAE
jgi:tripartite-type tricarboxylate transporter receptor subunit TctC